jgi:hypothetical protein
LTIVVVTSRCRLQLSFSSTVSDYETDGPSLECEAVVIPWAAFVDLTLECSCFGDLVLVMLYTDITVMHNCMSPNALNVNVLLSDH